MQSIWLWHHSNLTLFYQFLNNFLNIIKCIDRWLFGYIATLKYNSLNHLDVQGSIRLGCGGFFGIKSKIPADHLLFCIDLVLEPLSNTDWCKQNSYKNNPEIETKFRPNFTIFAMNSELQRIAHPMHLRLCFFCVNNPNNASKKPNRRWRLWLVVAGTNEIQIKSTKN